MQIHWPADFRERSIVVACIIALIALVAFMIDRVNSRAFIAHCIVGDVSKMDTTWSVSKNGGPSVVEKSSDIETWLDCDNGWAYYVSSLTEQSPEESVLKEGSRESYDRLKLRDIFLMRSRPFLFQDVTTPSKIAVTSSTR